MKLGKGPTTKSLFGFYGLSDSMYVFILRTIFGICIGYHGE